MPEIIDVIVRTNASKTEIVERGDVYKVNVKALPEKGKANEEIIKLFSKLTGRDVKIISGKTSKRKRLRIRK